MVKLVVLFRQPPDKEAFEQHYNRNLALMEKLPGLRRRQVGLTLGSPSGQSPYYRLLELHFDDFPALDAALTGSEGQAAGRDLMSFAGSLAELMFVEVYEEWTHIQAETRDGDGTDDHH